MLKQDRYYTYKFNSNRLKKSNYNIEITPEEAIRNEELIAQFENQIIDTIQEIQDRKLSKKKINILNKEIKDLKGQPYSEELGKLIEEKQNEIYKLMLIPEYITIKMDSKSDYKYLYEKGLTLNGKVYKRFNSSASQARVDTVLFIMEDILPDLTRITDNGRNLNKEIAPSKLNAYRGLYCSARRKVSTPRFCVVKDYESPTTMKVNWINETPSKHEDDELIEGLEITRDFNRFDGQGLITPTYAKKWAEELQLHYTPAQFCIRGSFLKGMLCVFDIHDFCEKKNGGNYLVETVYKDENGNPIMVDLRDVDAIITESQLKLWDSWSSVEHYRECCEENNLSWGVTLFTPEKDKDFMYQNYQFLQTLDLDKDDIEELCSKFVNWIQNVTHKDAYYTMLFLMGFNVNEEKYINFIKSSNMHWVKALILRPELSKYKYFRMKIYNMLKKRIKDGSIGQIITNGNFQVLISDPYAMMEAVCGHKEVKGLLPQGKHYSRYWNNKGVKLVVGSRSPLTYRSEHVKMELLTNDETEYWYEHIYTGIIINSHGDETARFAGADHDYDILATTCEPTIIKGVYDNELPVVYQEPKPKKTVPTDLDLYKADTFSFNSIIGSLTNKSTTGYAVLAKFDKGTPEYNLILKRIKTITKAQSAQIDKTKIGKAVKGIVTKWVKYQKITDVMSDDEKLEVELNNRVLMDKHPYFFKNLYKRTGKEYKDYIKKQEILSLQILGITLEELLNKIELNEREQLFLDNYNRYSPIINSDCVMNNLCKYIESVDFGIRNLLKNETEEDYHNILVEDFNNFDEVIYSQLKSTYEVYTTEVASIIKNNCDISKKESNNTIKVRQKELLKKLFSICNNEKDVTKYMVYLFFVDKPHYNKDVMWDLFGDYIIQHLLKNTNTINVPVLDDNGDIDYLNSKYTIKEVFINDVK